MIQYRQGDLFECGADCLVNAVNCEGIMGKGIAYQFKIRFPENNKSYIKACKLGELKIGKIHFFTENGITVINLPTKDKWRQPSKMEYVKEGMDNLVELLPTLGVKKIAIPSLGCGNGGLLWEKVKKVIEEKISGLKEEYDFLIFEPME
jgi:O-acetyl-ADP-ribose deacetylase (regulator of RNase III)